MFTVLDLAQEDTQIKKKSTKEYAGPCPDPTCGKRTDGFSVKWNGYSWVFMCRGCWDSAETLPGRDRKRQWGDEISYLLHYRHVPLERKEVSCSGTGLRLVAMKIVQASTELAEKHYAVHHGRHFYDSLITFLTSGPTVALVLEGREAIAVVRHLIGPTDGAKAHAGTIRGDFGLSVQNNLIHGSDSPESAASEIALWFRPDELIYYQPTDSHWILGSN